MITSLAEISVRADADVRRARLALEDAALKAAAAGISQRAIAQQLGRSQPEVARLIARARSRAGRTWLTAAEYGDVIDVELRSGDDDFALRLVRQALDALASRPPGELTLFLDERPVVGDIRWDRLIRAAVSWRCRTLDLTPPAWAHPTALDTFWFVRPEPGLRGRLLQTTPTELAIVGVWLDASSLRGV
jgi:hypothetical protein